MPQPPQRKAQAGGKHKMKRSSKDKNYYKSQFLRTARNKARQAARRTRRAAFWKGAPNAA